MEIWIANGTKRELKRQFSFVRDFAIVDVKEIAENLGYRSSLDLDEHSSYVLSGEIRKKIISLNTSKRFFRVLYIVEQLGDQLPQQLLNFSIENDLTYDKIYVLEKNVFELSVSMEDLGN